MQADQSRLLALAEAIADGRSIDWPEAEQSAGNQADRELCHQLRLLAGVAEIHRGSSAAGAHQPSRPDAPHGSSWGPLEIRERVGGGSFGTVYRAWDPRLAREVALKLLHRHTSDEEASIIIDEGRLLARVRYPHVVTVYGASRFGDRVGVWMEFIRGKTLEQVLAQDGPFGAREAALIGSDLCGALAAVHAQGVVHRDIKAHNVMREDGGRVVLMDFGAGEELADLSHARPAAGTPVYMAPELFEGGKGTPASDLYSLGVLLFRLVTGEYPVAGATMTEVAQAHARHERKRLRDIRPDLPKGFVHAVERALAPSVGDRVESAGSLDLLLNESLRSDGSSQQSEKTHRSWLRRRTLAAAVAVTAVIAALGSWWAYWPGSTPPAPAAMKIGIRPLKNLTGDDTKDYVAAGFSDVLLAKLGGLGALRLISLGPDEKSDPPSGVPVYAILDGSVQGGEGRLRVSARLVEVKTGAILWGRLYDGGTDVFALQGQIATDLARDLKISITENEARRLARQYVVSADAQNAYLRGRYLFDSLTRPNLEQARVEFERAVSLEPQYAPAYASLSRTYLALGVVGSLKPQEVRTLAPAAADTAFKIDPLHAESALAVAEVRFRLNWDWKGAEDAYRAAIDLNPSYMEARGQYARFLAASDRMDDALDEAREAYQVDPLSAEIHGVVGIMLYYHRRYDEAIEHFMSRLDNRTARGYVGLGRSLAAKGEFDESVAALTTAYERSGKDPSVLAEIGRTLAQAGRTTEARVVLAELYSKRHQGKEYVGPQDLAYIHVALGEHDHQAFVRLNEAVDEQASRLLWLAVDPRVASIKTDPRFAVLASRLGIPMTQSTRR